MTWLCRTSVEQGLTRESLAYWCRDINWKVREYVCMCYSMLVYCRVSAVVCWGQLSASATFFHSQVRSSQKPDAATERPSQPANPPSSVLYKPAALLCLRHPEHTHKHQPLLYHCIILGLHTSTHTLPRLTFTLSKLNKPCRSSSRL